MVGMELRFLAGCCGLDNAPRDQSSCPLYRVWTAGWHGEFEVCVPPSSLSRRQADMSADERHYSAEQVTGARQEGVVRWVLVISLLLIVGAMSAVCIIPALTG
jgi:hypothetical protein